MYWFLPPTLPGRVAALTGVASLIAGGFLVWIIDRGSEGGPDPIGLILAVVIASGIVSSVVYLGTRRLIRPIHLLNIQIQHAFQLDRQPRFDGSGLQEARRLAVSLNNCSDRITDDLLKIESGRERLESIFDNLGEGVIVVDENERIVVENAVAQELLQFSDGEGRPFGIVARDHDLLSHLRSAMQSDAASSTPIEYARSGLVLEATIIPVHRSEKRLGIVVLRDVTDLRRLEQVRREFVANVSHELRTPLASIRALADTLQAGAIDDPDVSLDFVERIVSEVDRLTALVNELLDLGRLEAGRVSLQTSRIPADDLVKGGAERLRPQTQRAGLDLRIELGYNLPDVLADRSRIEQVIVNLVHNAIKYTDAGGLITVSAERNGEGVRVDVTDTGTGIDQNELPRIFERFFKADRSRQSRGTGLGLAISKHIVLAHGGEIWASSELNQGTTLSFTLPAIEPGGVELELGPDGESAAAPLLI